jgi:hypothetical protein
MTETTREKYPELYKINKHMVSVYKERDYWKEKYIFLKDEFDIHKIKKNTSFTKRKNVTQSVRNYAISARSKELGIKNVFTYKKLLYLDPCVSNETEFYRSYLEEFHLKNRKF